MKISKQCRVTNTKHFNSTLHSVAQKAGLVYLSMFIRAPDFKQTLLMNMNASYIQLIHSHSVNMFEPISKNQDPRSLNASMLPAVPVCPVV